MNTSLICLQGLSGSGKTTVANFLASTLKMPVYHSDVERKALFGLSPSHNSRQAGMNIYTEEATRQTFQVLYSRAFEELSAGNSVIVDAAFLKHHERQTMRKLAEKAKARFLIVQCQADRQVMIDRINARRLQGDDPSEATGELVLGQEQWIEALTTDEIRMCIKVCTEDKSWQETLFQRTTHFLNGGLLSEK
ncbi:hypothetical protein GZ77_19520 [Endozoicomonas montiporae]|uniref:Uncharacterized protein n=2 Tax=Endozoicomonas montiporae TaxID=1027273 RepID=A0A081N2K4_9GAMM|nr:AAA family ATPase [Endozoicomonas montiporae]AMO54803.1 putative ATPase [Endozoicomonas montiporae CL-33]KEQ12677.1 hypothetical protein GZ77_19520 [Endozoicomonas montiporae]